MTKIAMKILFYVIILFTASAGAFSQGDLDQKYKLGESYEKSGDLNNAARIYEELSDQAPLDEKYFEAYARTMKLQNKFAELLPKVEGRYKARRTLSNSVLYGELLWRTGKADEAGKAWNEVIKYYGKSDEAYVSLAQTQIALRLYDKAIETYKAAYKEFGELEGITNELLRLYVATGNYKEGLAATLKALNQDDNLSLAQGRLYSFMINDEATKYFYNYFRNEFDKNKDNPYFLEMYSWFMRSVSKFDDALNAVVMLDALRQERGRAILAFADVARKDGDYDPALKAYSRILDMGRDQPYAASAMYGYARTMEDMLRSGVEVTAKQAEQIMEYYRKIISSYPKSSQDAEARLRIAYLLKDHYKKPKEAKNELEDLVKNFPNTYSATAAQLILAELDMSDGDLAGAQNIYGQIKRNVRTASPADRDLAAYRLGEILYFQGAIDSAKTIFTELSQNSNSDAANDALNKMLLIESNQNFVAAMKSFAAAEYALVRKDTASAIDKLNETVKYNPDEELLELAKVKLGGIKIGNGEYAAGREILQGVLRDNEDSIYGDLIYFMLANSYLKEGNKSEALNTFVQALNKYPKSIYTQEIRRLIKEIRESGS